MKFAISTALVWTLVFAAFLASISATDPHWASAMLRFFRTLVSILFVWYMLMAITSKGTALFAVGFSTSFILILLLKYANDFDPSRALSEWIGYFSAKAIVPNDGLTYIRRMTAYRELSMLVCASIGGILAVAAGKLNESQMSKRTL